SMSLYPEISRCVAAWPSLSYLPPKEAGFGAAERFGRRRFQLVSTPLEGERNRETKRSPGEEPGPQVDRRISVTQPGSIHLRRPSSPAEAKASAISLRDSEKCAHPS